MINLKQHPLQSVQDIQCLPFLPLLSHTHVHTSFIPIVILLLQGPRSCPVLKLHCSQEKYQTWHNFKPLPKLIDKDAHIKPETLSYLRHRCVGIFGALLLNCPKEWGGGCTFPESPQAHPCVDLACSAAISASVHKATPSDLQKKKAPATPTR